MYIEILVRMYNASDNYRTKKSILDRLSISERTDLAASVLSSWPPSDARLENSVSDYLSRVDISPFQGQLVRTVVRDIATRGSSSLLWLIHGLDSSHIDSFLVQTTDLQPISQSILDTLMKLSARASGPYPLHKLITRFRPQIASRPQGLLESAEQVLNRRFRSLDQLERFLARNQYREGADLLIKTLMGVCTNDHMNSTALVRSILKGGRSRYAAVRILRRIFDQDFPASLNA